MSIFVLKNNFQFRKRRFDVVVLKSDLLSSNSFHPTVLELRSNRHRQGNLTDLEDFNDSDKTPVELGANLTKIDKFFFICLLDIFFIVSIFGPKKDPAAGTTMQDLVFWRSI